MISTAARKAGLDQAAETTNEAAEGVARVDVEGHHDEKMRLEPGRQTGALAAM